MDSQWKYADSPAKNLVDSHHSKRDKQLRLCDTSWIVCNFSFLKQNTNYCTVNIRSNNLPGFWSRSPSFGAVRPLPCG